MRIAANTLLKFDDDDNNNNGSKILNIMKIMAIKIANKFVE
jgi:hypothetical protein